jgi:curli biogenesis system outer membrane secretion channel CsgG
MIRIILAAMLFAPGFVQAKALPGGKPQEEKKETSVKTSSYRQIAAELLKNCEGKDKAIAVAGFSYSDRRESRDGSVIAERLTTELVKVKKFKIIEREEIEKVFTELKLQESGAVGAESIKSAGKMLGVDWMILGTLTELEGRQIEVNARLVAVGSGEIINAYTAAVKKDWRDRPVRESAGENELRESDELKEYDKAILKYMDEKTGKKQQIKQPPSF